MTSDRRPEPRAGNTGPEQKVGESGVGWKQGLYEGESSGGEAWG